MKRGGELPTRKGERETREGGLGRKGAFLLNGYTSRNGLCFPSFVCDLSWFIESWGFPDFPCWLHG